MGGHELAAVGLGGAKVHAIEVLKVLNGLVQTIEGGGLVQLLGKGGGFEWVEFLGGLLGC